MKNLVVVVTIVFGIVGLVFGLVYGVAYLTRENVIFALVQRDVEFIFRVTDAESGEPIAGAVISIRAEAFQEKGHVVEQIKLVTDDQGLGRILRKDLMFDDVIRPFRKTVSEIPRAWCGLSIRAKGYTSIDNRWLAEMTYEDLGVFETDKGHFNRAEFRITLQKK